MKRLFLAVGLALMAPGMALAHPVAYQGSVGIMGYHSPGMSDMELNYSIRHWIAPSVQTMRFTEGTSRPDFVLGKINLLAYRKNGADYQGNVYLHAGGGHSLLSRRGVYHGGITADIEDRRLYFLTQWDVTRSSAGTEAWFWKVRGGFAPYIGQFEDLHSWLILEANRKNLGDKRIELVPTLRFFYQNVLWEVGASLKGEIHFNYIIHI
jgi:hypothetical protein